MSISFLIHVRIYQASLLEVPGNIYWALTPNTGTASSEVTPLIIASAHDDADEGGSGAAAGGSGSDRGAEAAGDECSGSVTTHHDCGTRGKKRYRDGGDGEGNVKASGGFTCRVVWWTVAVVPCDARVVWSSALQAFRSVSAATRNHVALRRVALPRRSGWIRSSTASTATTQHASLA